MSFFSTYWPQLVIVLGLIVIFAIFIRRIPKTVDKKAAKVHKEVKEQSKMDRKEKLVAGWTKVRNGFVAAFSFLKEKAHEFRDKVVQKQKKEEVSAVSAMFDEVNAEKKEEPAPKTPAAAGATAAEISASVNTPDEKQDAEKKRKTDDLLRRAKQYLKEDRMKDAEKTYFEAVQLSPRDERVYFDLGEMYFESGNTGDAKASYLEVLKLNNTNVSAISKLGLMAFRDKQYVEAAKRYEEATKVQPDEPKHLANLGLVMKTTGKDKKAFGYYVEAFQMSNKPEHGIPAIELALAIKKPKKAQAVLDGLKDSVDPKILELRTQVEELIKK